MKLKILSIALFFIFILSGAYIVYQLTEGYLFYHLNQQWSKSVEESSKDEGNSKILAKYRDIYEENPEFAGWIRIKDTMMDYPVMKPMEDNDFYLTHGPSGERSKYGAIYLDVASDLFNQQGNWILYGHYFKDGSMFGMLQEYEQEAFYKEHPTIEFDTIYQEGTYEIIAVFLSKVYQQDQNIFKYYKYTDIQSQEEFEAYVRGIKELSLYPTGKTASYGDSLITLSTCDYWTENGRLAVVAKKLECSAKKQ
ncbi:class B sortase [Aminipila butyrica]|uniref:Class B sortase n=1 Tax=Aminipila butyrica TaxID=433296 RepID=A0A858BX94_9FIRM|nr:class B sortase [Aminipila butyrica]QIB69344.1 class B sortase [Aminipila butyrica]